MERTKKVWLLQQVRGLFIRYGIKSLTMDDIARHLSISKKTLYQLCSNKADLVKMVTDQFIAEEKKKAIQVSDDAGNSVEEMIGIIGFVTETLSGMNPASLYDLQRYYPDSWHAFETYRYRFIYERMLLNMQRGVKEGVYRKELDTDVIARIYVTGMDAIFNPKTFPSKQMNFLKVYKEYLNYHLRGIVSDKGLKILEKQKIFTD